MNRGLNKGWSDRPAVGNRSTCKPLRGRSSRRTRCPLPGSGICHRAEQRVDDDQLIGAGRALLSGLRIKPAFITPKRIASVLHIGYRERHAFYASGVKLPMSCAATVPMALLMAFKTFLTLLPLLCPPFGSGIAVALIPLEVHAEIVPVK